MKRAREIEDVSLFDQILSETPKEDRIFISNSLEISNQILLIMEEKGMLQKELAALLGKTEGEISRWLSGSHNFTIRTISRIQAILDRHIIVTPNSINREMSSVLDNLFVSLKAKQVPKVRLENSSGRVCVTTKSVSLINLPSGYSKMRFSKFNYAKTATNS